MVHSKDKIYLSNYSSFLADYINVNFASLALHFEFVLQFTNSAAAQYLQHYYSNKEEEQQGNIPDKVLQLFNSYYGQNELSSPVCYAGSAELRDEFKLPILPNNAITEDAIFHYVYAVLHHHAYHTEYQLDVTRNFRRIPLYDNFRQWASWGKKLMELHIHYETFPPYPLQIREIAAKEHPKALLRALKNEGIIQLDENTELRGIPKEAWHYKLANCSALEWVLTQYMEKKETRPAIAEHSDIGHLAGFKEKFIQTLQQACTVSIETEKIKKEMP